MTTGSDFQGDFIAKTIKAAAAWPQRRDRAVPAVRFCNTSPKRMTAKKLLIAAALVACASPALAGTFVSTWGCKYSRFYGYSNCSATSSYVREPVRDPEQERQDAIARQKENAKWEAFCQPTFRADEYGIRRASYAKQGCEFGRSE